MNIGFVALETFVPTQKYIEWSRLVQVEEIISLDCMLCPNVIRVLQDEDTKYLQQQDFYCDIFFGMMLG